MLDLYESTFDARWLERAVELEKAMVSLFWDEAEGGFFFDGSDGEKLFLRRKEIFDGAIPSGNSVALLDTLRLERITGDAAKGRRAERLARAFAGDVSRMPSAHAQFLVGVDFAIGPTREIVIAGAPGGEDVRAMLRAVRGRYLPRKVVLLHPEGGEEARAIERIASFIAEQRSIGGKAAAYVCRDRVCALPVTDAAALARSLSTK